MSTLHQRLVAGETKLAIVGMGYVGMPLAIALAKHVSVIGFDLNADKIAKYRAGIDPTMEVGDDAIRATSVDFTSDEERLEEAQFFIVAVPTPIFEDKRPDLRPMESACRLVGRHLKADSIIVFESTVYPGVTENVCVPILERESGLRCGPDFKVGYSPERINPGDKLHRLDNICKIVSGMDEESLQTISDVYAMIIDAGVHPVSSIRTAEAIKLVENSQRDINIAFINEMAMLFDLLNIDSNEVIDGMDTKWNALGFRPGLVGGHCIGIDPYYLMYEADKHRFTDHIVAASRRINDVMGKFVARAAVRQMSCAGLAPSKAKVVIMGMTFKEDCPDIRNTRTIDIYNELREYNISPLVCDPWADPDEVRREYDLDLTPLEDIRAADCVIIAVGHKAYRDMPFDALLALFEGNSGSDRVIIDVKGIVDKRAAEAQDRVHLWRL